MNFTKVNDLSIGYREKGTGDPLVLLHGGLSDSRYWQRELETFSDSYRVIAWDAPGCGVSDDPPEDFSLADYANTLAAFLGKIEVNNPHVLGLSFGGGLALALYDQHPKVPKSLILVSAYAGWGGSLPPEEVARRLELMEKLIDQDIEALADEMIPTFFSSSPTEEMIKKEKDILVDYHPAGIRAMTRGFAEADLTGMLHRIDCPTLLLYGDQDVRSPIEVAENIHHRIPTSALKIIPGAGHVVNLEAPQAFDLNVREFLLKHL